MTIDPPAPDASCDVGLQLLDARGELRLDPAHSPEIERLGDDDLKGMYLDMALTRRFDAEATALQRQGELGLWVSSEGQEAAQVGSARALAADDYVFPSYRDHGVLRARGLDLARVLPLFRGSTHGGWDPAETNTHLYTLVVGSQALHATGYAMGMRRDRSGAGVVVYFGDGATSQGDVNEAMVFAAAANAPVLFFCVNNQFAISESVSRQSRVPLYQRATGFGIPSLRVDGNDVLACYAATRAAMRRIRAGEGPAMIEAYTYRMGAHTTSDDPTRYRSSDVTDAWRARDPIARLGALLAARGVGPEFLEDVAAQADALGEHVRAYCRAIPEPSFEDCFAHVYATPNPLVLAELAEVRSTRAGAVATGVFA